MAKVVIGSKGIESAVRAASAGESVILLARSYDKLVRDLEYVLSHLSEENMQPAFLKRLEERDP
ncbi:MAG: hypothetical protein IJW70_10950 [Clostridia bacterium]|nr:hypothetical protein [Clostridia bacterium]